MNITLEHEFDLEDTYAKLGELAENPPHFATSDAFADEDDAPVAFDGRSSASCASQREARDAALTSSEGAPP